MKNSKNIFTGSRKIFNNKKSLKKTKNNILKNGDAFSLSSSDKNKNVNNNLNNNFINNTNNNLNNNLNNANYDPLLVNAFIPVDQSGKIQNINRIGKLLGNAPTMNSETFNNFSQLPNNNSNNISNEMMGHGQQMMSHQIQGQQMMSPQMMNPQIQGQQMMNPQMQNQDYTNILKNLSHINTIPRLI